MTRIVVCLIVILLYLVADTYAFYLWWRDLSFIGWKGICLPIMDTGFLMLWSALLGDSIDRRRRQK